MPQPASKMYTTIHREPDDLRAILARGWDQVESASAALTQARRVFCVGIGTSYHAALNAEFQLRLAGCDARAMSSYDFVTYPPDLTGDDVVVAFSHRGFKRYSAASIVRARQANIRVVIVTGLQSAIEGSDLVLRTVPQEESAAFTSSHTGAVFVTAQLAFAVGRRLGRIAEDLEPDFERLPSLIEDVLRREPHIAEVAEYGLRRRTFCAGAGPDAALAAEAALKAREAAYTTIDGMATEQFIHGPMVTVNPDDLAILVSTTDAGRERTTELAGVLARIGTRTWVIGKLDSGSDTATPFDLPSLHPLLAPVVALAPIQLYACYQAASAGTNADSFRRDVPPYGEAFALLKL